MMSRAFWNHSSLLIKAIRPRETFFVLQHYVSTQRRFRLYKHKYWFNIFSSSSVCQPEPTISQRNILQMKLCLAHKWDVPHVKLCFCWFFVCWFDTTTAMLKSAMRIEEEKFKVDIDLCSLFHHQSLQKWSTFMTCLVTCSEVWWSCEQ